MATTYPCIIIYRTCRNRYGTPAQLLVRLLAIIYERYFMRTYFISDTSSTSLPYPLPALKRKRGFIFFRIFIQENPHDLRHFPRGFRQCPLHQAGFASVCVIGRKVYF
jgi:hypothetical protein